MSETTTTEATNVLEELSHQFKTTERTALTIEGVDSKIYTQPCNLEDNLRLVAIAEEKNSAKRAKAMAGFLVEKVETETGQRAFRNCNNQPAAQVLRTSVSPSVILDLFGQIAATASTEETEELEGKSDEPDAAS